MTSPPRIELTADFGSGPVTGVFEAFVIGEGSGDVGDDIRTGFLLSGAGDQAIGFLLGLLDAGETARKGVHYDAGGGEHAIPIRANVTSGPTPNGEGGVLQWGASADPDVLDQTTATGGTAIQKAQIFNHYLSVAGGGTDSLAPATLEWGEYSTDGVLDPLEVVLEEPSFERQGPDSYRFSTTCVETATLGSLLDGSKQTDG
ncbi:hypothetical protein [Salinilacihabitans rarus]|uniref:hypothetical protein n=1 Tax=Salinilacihabitans rarus TaxID=2961596 RepID=UPI0020C83577|nr:hypothetical protein [Salinilacihabitans rarus]